MDEDVKRIIERFEMRLHPEGGFFCEVYRSDIVLEHPHIPDNQNKVRRASTSIYYLLAEHQFSAFHRVKWTDEIWHLYAGGPLELHILDTHYERRVLTSPLADNQPTAVVHAGAWQATRLAPGARWAFAGCTVAPGFDFDDFEMPPAQQLIAIHPEHAKIIRELTRC